MVLRYVVVFLFLSSFALAQDFAGRFDTAWRLINERYWDLSRLSVDWNEVRQEYEPEALAAKDEAEFYAVLERMYDEIGDHHSVFVPPDKVLEIRASYGDLPCLGVFAQATQGKLGHVSYELLEGHIGYIELPDLASDYVASHVRDAVKALELAGADSYILDMRGNPGGRLVSMMQIAGVFTTGFLWRTITNWTLPLPYPAIGNPETEDPLLILIDGGVNSAAEGLAGALQKRERATIVGEASAGNVEAVMPFCLRDGSQAWIATGVLAPIGGPTWEGVGVVPDIESSSESALKMALRYINETF
ncbi:MAG: hypothetical protein KC422_24240 [Trueperaceae bacterium]|nr:hypothetical protein [Trueperaceae bacterium]